MTVQGESADGETAGRLMGRSQLLWTCVSGSLVIVVQSGDAAC